MSINRDKAQELLDAIDEIGKRSGERVSPSEAAWVNQTVTALLSRAQVHATLALTDPKDEVSA